MSEYKFKLPDIGEGVVEAEITAWHVKVGDRVEEDDPVADAMTDKATVELTAPVTGVITAVGCEAGDILAVGADLAIFDAEGDVEEDKPEEVPASKPKAKASGTSEYKFKMPDIGEGVVEAEITAWHVKVGDDVEEDDPVADAMTDKATIELTAPVTGKVKAVGCEEGEIISVGADLVIFDAEGDVEGEDDAATATPSKKSKPKREAKAPAPKPKSDKVLASPAVRRRAKEQGVDLAKISASGDEGQVTQDDLEKFNKALEPLEGENRIKIIGLRRVIAERMQASKRNIPHFTYVEEMDVTELEALRKRLNEKRGEDMPKLTVLPFIIRAMVSALREWPQVNARYNDEQGFVSQFEGVHLGIATQTDTGLIVPVLKNVQSKSVWETASEIKRLSEGARNNELGKYELTGATTTLTSLGPLGGLVTTPVINRPEVAIFGPNKIQPKLIMEDGEVKERLVMNFSISCDHRIIDGYDAATMMQYIKGLLEDPIMMFLE